MTTIWRKSPQEVDPLSWFMGRWVPLLFSGAAVVQGAVITVLHWSEWSSPALQFVAMPFFLGAGVLTASTSNPTRPRFRFRDASGILALASAGLVVSALGTYGGSLTVSDWWPGIALAATLVGIAPYSTPRKQLISFVPLVVFVAVVGWTVFAPTETYWTPATLVMLVIGPVLVGGLSAIVFSYTFVARTLALLDTSLGSEEIHPASELITEAEQRESVARMSARVAPFLEEIAAAGVITIENRALAAQLARRLRTDLVSATSRSWLEALAMDTGMVVSDPSRLADSMNESQRAALRGLLVAALGNVIVDQRTVLVELRPQPDGGAAAAITLDVDLPEGRRWLMLAPYYLTLKTTVDDLSWNDGNQLSVRFRIGPS